MSQASFPISFPPTGAGSRADARGGAGARAGGAGGAGAGAGGAVGSGSGSCYYSQPPPSSKYYSTYPISPFANAHTKEPDSPPSSHPSIQQRPIPSIC